MTAPPVADTSEAPLAPVHSETPEPAAERSPERNPTLTAKKVDSHDDYRMFSLR